MQTIRTILFVIFVLDSILLVLAVLVQSGRGGGLAGALGGIGSADSALGAHAATQIEKACNLGIGAEGYCSKEISDSFTFYQTPEGFIIPKSMIDDRGFIIKLADGEEAREIQEFVDEKRRAEEEKIKKRQERRAEINREIAEKKRENKKDQLGLFGD